MEDKIRAYYPGWTLMRKVGEGSFGAVYEIVRTHYGATERAAVKIISIPQKKSDIEALYSDGYDTESIARRYRGYKDDIVREYTTMAMLGTCPNVVHGIDHSEIPHPDGIGWDILIMMELLTPLTKCHGLSGDDAHVLKMGKDLCNALIECKNHGIIHRDIKPQNIFISANGTFKLGDFGIAKNVERTTGGTKIGTYGYMAPEVYYSQPYGTAADVYSLGLVLYWMLNEHRGPFLPLPPKAPTAGEEASARRRRLSGEPLPPPANGSDALKAIILKACAWNVSDRYHTAQEMYDALEALENSNLPLWEMWLQEQPGVVFAEKQTPKKSVKPILWLIPVILVIIGLIVGAAVFLPGMLDKPSEEGKSASVLSQVNSSPEQAVCGLWETTLYHDPELTRSILEDVDFQPEEIAFLDLNSLMYTVQAEFRQDDTYRFAVNADSSKAYLSDYFYEALDRLYENRNQLTEVLGKDLSDYSKSEFLQYYAELYGYSDIDLLVSQFVENSFDYEALGEDYEIGTYRIDGDQIYCLVSGESEETYMDFELNGNTLTLIYSDGVEVYQKR